MENPKDKDQIGHSETSANDSSGCFERIKELVRKYVLYLALAGGALKIHSNEGRIQELESKNTVNQNRVQETASRVLQLEQRIGQDGPIETKIDSLISLSDRFTNRLDQLTPPKPEASVIPTTPD